MRPIFQGFCINRFGIGPLHYISSRSDFGFEFMEIFLIEKRLPYSACRGVGDSLTQRVGESSTPRLREVGVDMVSLGVAIQIILNLSSIYRTFYMSKPAFKGPIWQTKKPGM